MRKKQRPPVDPTEHIELEGPASVTLTPPPARRAGPTVLAAVLLLALLGVVGVLLARPELVTVVQAFVGDF